MAMRRLRLAVPAAACFLTLGAAARAADTPPDGWAPSAASWLGGADDGVAAGVVIQSDGTVVVAANIGTASPGGVTSTNVNGATASSGGAVVRLSSDGTTVLGVTRVASAVADIALGPDDSIFVAALGDGLVRLSADGTTVLFSEDVANPVHRIDVGADGRFVVLTHDETAWEELSDPGGGTIIAYAADGTQTGTRGGHHNTLDVVLDSASSTVISCGWRQFNTAGNPVQIAHLYGHALDASLTEKYRDYDWGHELNDPENNMADTRCYRLSLGADGKAYAAYEAAGGNHQFRYDPHDINVSVSALKGAPTDDHHAFYNSRSEHKTVFARYTPGTGDVERWQEFCARLGSGAANTVRTKGGAIFADADGTVFVGGASAWGLPLDDENGWLPTATGDYTGGAWLLVMNSDFGTPRQFVTRLNDGGTTKGIAARTVNGQRVVAWAGAARTDKPLYTVSPTQGSAAGGAQEGFYAVIGAPIAPCTGASDCDDGDACTQDACSGGRCEHTATPNCCTSAAGCDDNDPCTTDACDASACVHTATAGCCSVDGDCNDGDACTSDTCSLATHTCAAAAISGCCAADGDCSDGSACTVDTCDPNTQRCVFTPTAGCCSGTADCTDTNPCTTESCEVGTGTCSYAANPTCCQTDGDCADGDSCTVDTCASTTNTCSNVGAPGCCTSDAACGAGTYCNLNTNTCDATSGVGGTSGLGGSPSGGAPLGGGDTSGRGGASEPPGSASGADDDSGCSCRVVTGRAGGAFGALGALGAAVMLGLVGGVRRRRPRP